MSIKYGPQNDRVVSMSSDVNCVYFALNPCVVVEADDLLVAGSSIVPLQRAEGQPAHRKKVILIAS